MKKKREEKEKKHICIRIGSAGLYIYFGIRVTVKLLERKRVLHTLQEQTNMASYLANLHN